MGYEAQEGFAGEPMHVWWIKSDHGAVHIWARVAHLEGWPSEWIGGVECHWAKCPDDGGWFKPDEPSQPDCWLLHGPCWHDGTSLYFRERIAPYLPFPDSDDRNDLRLFPITMIECLLAEWHSERIATAQGKQGEADADPA